MQQETPSYEAIVDTLRWAAQGLRDRPRKGGSAHALAADP